MKSEVEFWTVISHYNTSTIIIQICLIVLGILFTVLVYRKPQKNTQIVMKIYLAFIFAWMGIVFFYIEDGSELSLNFVGPLFLVLSGLFCITIGRSEIQFLIPQMKWQKIITYILYFLVLAYPAISFGLGHSYPAISTPMMPCPTTIFALALIWGSDPFKNTEESQKVDRALTWVIIIGLTIWGLMGLPKMFGLFNVREDTILFLSGVYSIVMIIHVIIKSKKNKGVTSI